MIYNISPVFRIDLQNFVGPEELQNISPLLQNFKENIPFPTDFLLKKMTPFSLLQIIFRIWNTVW